MSRPRPAGTVTPTPAPDTVHGPYPGVRPYLVSGPIRVGPGPATPPLPPRDWEVVLHPFWGPPRIPVGPKPLNRRDLHLSDHREPWVLGPLVPDPQNPPVSARVRPRDEVGVTGPDTVQTPKDGNTRGFLRMCLPPSLPWSCTFDHPRTRGGLGVSRPPNDQGQ